MGMSANCLFCLHVESGWLVSILSTYLVSPVASPEGGKVGGSPPAPVRASLYASFLKGQGHQGIFSLVKGTLWGKL